MPPAPPDHLDEAKRIVDTAALTSGESAQIHALIAIAESHRGQALLEDQQLLRTTPAHLLRTDDILADGSVVVSVEEGFEEPDVTYVTVVQHERNFKLAMLRTTPVGLKT